MDCPQFSAVGIVNVICLVPVGESDAVGEVEQVVGYVLHSAVEVAHEAAVLVVVVLVPRRLSVAVFRRVSVVGGRHIGYHPRLVATSVDDEAVEKSVIFCNILFSLETVTGECRDVGVQVVTYALAVMRDVCVYVLPP